MTHRIGAACVLLLAMVCSTPAVAQDAAMPDPAKLALGEKLYASAGCHNCHGSKGQGGISVDFPRGPSLRASQLDHQGMVEIITCGIPDTRMAAWLKGAYSETACFGEPLGPAPSGTIVTGVFTADEINALVDYIETAFMRR